MTYMIPISKYVAEQITHPEVLQEANDTLLKYTGLEAVRYEYDESCAWGKAYNAENVGTIFKTIKHPKEVKE